MSIKNPIHLEILDFITKSKFPQNDWVQHYLGSNKKTFDIKSLDIKKFSKRIVEQNNLNQTKLIELLNSLYQNGTTFNEINIAACILGTKREFCKNLDPKLLDNWLNYTQGWAEDDVLCQSIFTAENVLAKWSEWAKILKKFNQDSNINKRRASLVLLTKSVRQSDDPKLSKLAFENIEKLKGETDILITKAVSWLLRSLITFHKDEVLKYLEDNKDSLPKIAYREALSKALTGRKYNNSKKQK